MQHILTRLQELDRLYHSDTLAEYETKWQAVEQEVRQTLPGFTIAYAEIYLSGSSRLASGRMNHVLVPRNERNDS
jgi:hypothetical protein